MYTVSLGGKTLLTERQEGTLTRLMTTPTTPSQVLVGKMTGTYMIGLAQMMILIGASALLLGLRWGNPPALGILLLTAVAAATGWGMLLAAVSRRPGEVSAWGMAMTLLVRAGGRQLLRRYSGRVNGLYRHAHTQLLGPEGFQHPGEWRRLAGHAAHLRCLAGNGRHLTGDFKYYLP